jgi:PAS domain S-box-containing protein
MHAEPLLQTLTIYNKIPGMLLIIDHADRLIGASDRWLQALGYPRHEVIGRPSGDFCSCPLTRLIYVPEFFTHGHIQEVECQFICKSGEVLDVVLAATPECDSTGEIIYTLVAIRDITRRKRIERLLREVSERTAPVTGGDFFRSLVQNLSMAMHAPYVFVTECTDQTARRVRTLASLEYQVLVESAEWNVAGTTCEHVLQGEICYYPEKLGLMYAEYLNKRQSYLGLPLFDSQGAIIGHLAIFDTHPTAYDPQEIAILKIFAARAGAEIERKHAEDARRRTEIELRQLNERLKDTNQRLEELVEERMQEIQRRSQVAESLYDMVMILNSEHPLDEILDYIIAAATKLLNTPSAAIYQLEPDAKTLTIQNARGLPEAYANNLRFSLERSFMGQAILQRHPVVITDVAKALQARNIELDAARRTLLAERYQSLLAVPLIRQAGPGRLEGAYGGLALYYPVQRNFSDEEIGLAVAFAAQAALAIENARLRQQAGQMAVMEERGRLARELHDSVTQSLYSLTLLAAGWRRMAKAGRLAPEQVEELLTELGEIGQQALREMRLLVYELRPVTLEQEGLAGALRQRLNAVEKRAGVETKLLIPIDLLLPPTLESELYRLAQEALNNVLKHAAPTAVTVQLQVSSDRLVLEIIDNGRGFDLATLAERQGIGIHSMKERAAKLSGSVHIASLPGQGTTVRVEIPYESIQGGM